MKYPGIAILILSAIFLLPAQQSTINIGNIVQGQRPAIAIPDLKGVADAQAFMPVFNQTLWADVSGAGIFKMVPKTMYPTYIPQDPSQFTTPPPPPPPSRRRHRGQGMTTAPSGGGRWLTDWSTPPVSANYLAIGYTAVQNGVFVLRGGLFDLRRDSPSTAQVFWKNYLGSVGEDGARKVAHQFAADIIALFGGQSLFGTHIYFVSQRTGNEEIWVMDPDGGNQKQITRFHTMSLQPAISPDGSKIAFTSYYHTNPGIFVFSVDPVRDLRFYNQRASVNETASFTPDGNQIVYASSAPDDHCCRIYLANLNGTGLRPITSGGYIDVEPKVNPKTGTEIAFVSGRSGPQQIYRMNIDGGDIERLSEGTGEAANPAWSPDGQFLAFAWTRGYSTGKFNIFVMDAASHKYTQLTHDEGRNENPSWAPDGRHIVFMSNRRGPEEIFTMLADGSQVQQLTTQGVNKTPVWGK